MISATVAGAIGSDAELEERNGTPCAKFSIAHNDRGKDGETIWVSCSIFGKRAGSLAQYLVKGTRVCVTGRLRVWSSKDGKPRLGVDVSEIELLGGGQRSEKPSRSFESKPAEKPAEDDFSW